MKKIRNRCYAMLILAALTVNLFADEGMWTFDNPPLNLLKEKYDFEKDQAWFDHVRLSSVRFNNGGSGSFVSNNGLVITNHHVAVGIIQKLSSEVQNYVQSGFYAKRMEDELLCPDLELNVLVNLWDVTVRVQGVVTPEMTDAEAQKARTNEKAMLEKEYSDSTGMRCEVVTLYHGGEYWLYQYKQYKDVRLVMAPERMAAYFGGDDDNFTYPRHDLDITFFRVYENGQPLKNKNFLKVSPEGIQKDDLVFISGNPGRTSRLNTVDQIVYQRDLYLPVYLEYIQNRINVLKAYSTIGPEEMRRAKITIFSLENSKKAYTGMLKGLHNTSALKRIRMNEEIFIAKIQSDSALNSMYGNAWDSISSIVESRYETFKPQFYRKLRGSRLVSWAEQAVFYAFEKEKPDSERLDGYHDSEIEEKKFYFLSRAPIYKDFEIANLAGCLQMSINVLGKEDEFIQTVLKGDSVKAFIGRLIGDTQLDDRDFREKIWDTDIQTLRQSEDPLIQLLVEMEPMLRRQIVEYRDEVESPLNNAAEKIAKARFELYGKSLYPDATFTLRLTYGAIKGYPMNGTQAPYFTTLYGLFDRSISFDKADDYKLPERYWKKQKSLDLSTPVNFVCTCDIIGGNSGSPVVNRNAEFVGIVFDGNIESLPGRYYFDPDVNRAVSVHAAYILEALNHIYNAKRLVKELQ